MSGPGCERRLTPQDVLVADAGLDPAEVAVLTVARHYFQSFAFPQSQAWINGFARAEQMFPPGSGRARAAEIAVAVLAAVQAMRGTRATGFRFSNPDCPGCSRILSVHERQFIEVLAAIRRGRRGRAQVTALMVCEGNAHDAFLRAMSDLAALMGNPSPSRGCLSGPQLDRGPAVP